MVTAMSTSPTHALARRDVVAKLLEHRGDALVVTGLGSPTYDVHAAGDRDDNFYLWGAMGGAALVGLGLAQAQPGKRVLVITGDGEQLMAFGGLATIAVAKPRNLTIVVIDNHHYGETGMQLSHTGRGMWLRGGIDADDDGIRRSDLRRGRRTAPVRHQGRGRRPAALAAIARRCPRQEPIPRASRARVGALGARICFTPETMRYSPKPRRG
jgi:hypothetical protein